MRKSLAFAALLALLALSSCTRQPTTAASLVSVEAAVSHQRIDALVEREMANRKIVGASLAIVQNGKVVHAQGYGFADIQSATRATDKSRFNIASMTKMFVATALMLLVEDRRVQLDQPIGDLLSDLPTAWGRITVRQLLNHTSGIQGFTEFEDNFPCPTNKPVRDYAIGDVLVEVSCLPLAFAPGSDFLYSETNYHLLAMVIAAASGDDYQDFMRSRVLEPIGMRDTDFLKWPDEPDQRATGYARLDDGGVEVPELVPNVELSLVSTLGDLALFDQALSDSRLLPPAVRDSMWAASGVGTARYGLGFSSRPIDGRRQVGHTGGGPAAATSFARFLDDDLTIVLLTNTAQPPGSIQSFVDAIADEILEGR